jgi:hypothetical protein
LNDQRKIHSNYKVVLVSGLFTLVVIFSAILSRNVHGSPGFGSAKENIFPVSDRDNQVDDSTLYGRFAYYLTGSENDRQLCKQDTSPILPEEIPELYGTENGMKIYDNGLDICSWEYAARKGYPRPLEPVYQDLSDDAGWPRNSRDPWDCRHRSNPGTV